MKIVSVMIDNFLSIGSASVKLAGGGLVLIQGENKDDGSADSNGAGKSSLAEAVCWALYGCTARGEDTDAVVNTKAGKNCRVAVYIEDDGVQYGVIRYRKHTPFKNAVQLFRYDGKDVIELTLGTEKLTQQRINKLIGCSYEVFAGSIYAGQERMPDLPAMTDRELKALIEEASGSTVLEAAYANARERLAVAKGLLDHVNRNHVDVETRIDMLNRQKDNTVTEHAAWTAKHITESANQRVAIQEEIVSIKADQGALKALDLPARRKALAEITMRISMVSAEQAQLRDLDDEIVEARADVGEKTRTIAALKDLVVECDKENFAAQDSVGTPCPDCGRPITAAEIEPIRARLRDERADLCAQIARETALLESAQKALQSLVERRDAFAASMTDVSRESAASAAIAKQISDGEAQEREIARRIEAVKLRKEVWERFWVMVSPYKALLDKFAETEAEFNAERDRIQKLLDKARVDVDVIAATVKVFSPAGVRARILDEVTPFLNGQTAKYLAILSDGNLTATWSTLVKNAKGELKEKFSIEVSAAGGKTFKALSGGERRKVRIATALALQDLVARRASKPIELFIGDEIDDALDDAGLERLMAILEEKARERGSVFVISHRSLRDWISNVITVVKKDGQATVEEEVT